jgi:tetratricopeptide (TPR) repeat protein
LAKEGHCEQAVPLLRKALSLTADKELKRQAGFAGVRCAMSENRADSALEFLRFLNREFPHDPDVLYISVHTYSDLSTAAAQELAATAPESSPSHKLNAEAFETQGKWDDAEKEYRAIIAQDPNLPGIHFRLGRLLLSKPNPPATVADEARREFTEELAIDPSNAGAEYVLGELARQDQAWDDAVTHFSKATKLDSQFGEAFLGLGTSLISLKRYAEATAPLETAVKIDPRNPDAHYQLATAYTRAGRKEDGQKEFAVHQRLIKTQGGAVEQTPGAAQPPDGHK